MKKKELSCPYCHKKIGFVKAFQSKTNEEFFCENCEKFSKVMVKPTLKNTAKLLAVLVGITVFIFTFFAKFYIFGTLVVLLLFGAFYLQVPRYIVLKKRDRE